MSKKNSSDTIGNRSRDLPTCSAVPQPTASPRLWNIDAFFSFLIREYKRLFGQRSVIWRVKQAGMALHIQLCVA